MSTARATARNPSRPTRSNSAKATPTPTRSRAPAAPGVTTGEITAMPRRNLNPSHVKVMPPVDSLGRLRVYFDLDLAMSTGLSMLAAENHKTKRDFLEALIRQAILDEPNIAAMLDIH